MLDIDDRDLKTMATFAALSLRVQLVGHATEARIPHLRFMSRVAERQALTQAKSTPVLKLAEVGESAVAAGISHNQQTFA